uniref:Uncharacterized protein n=1 Tax=Arundo donax TaxID=35708 RepID=A0A0A9GEM4_ARUDO
MGKEYGFTRTASCN